MYIVLFSHGYTQGDTSLDMRLDEGHISYAGLFLTCASF